MLQLYVSPSLAPFFLSLSLSWPLCLAFSFRVVIPGVTATWQRRTSTALGTVCQLVERDSNSIGWLAGLFAAELASRSVSVLCPRSVVRVPSRSRARQNMPTGFCTFTSNVHSTACGAIHTASDLFYPLPGPLALSSCSFPLSLFSILRQLRSKLRAT